MHAANRTKTCDLRESETQSQILSMALFRMLKLQHWSGRDWRAITVLIGTDGTVRGDPGKYYPNKRHCFGYTHLSITTNKGLVQNNAMIVLQALDTLNSYSAWAHSAIKKGYRSWQPKASVPLSLTLKFEVILLTCIHSLQPITSHKISVFPAELQLSAICPFKPGNNNLALIKKMLQMCVSLPPPLEVSP